MRIRDFEGHLIEAEIDIKSTAQRYEITLHACGGSGLKKINPGYDKALVGILNAMKRSKVRISKAYVSSGPAMKLRNEEDRQFSSLPENTTIPAHMPPAVLAARLKSEMAGIARAPNATGGGNRQKRITFEVHEEIGFDTSESQENIFTPSRNVIDPTEDGRRRIIRQIAERRGQPKFRKDLVDYFGGCVITGCKDIPALEAAHIIAYNGDETNSIYNGLLLRSDIHTLFDLSLVKINPATFAVEWASKIESGIYREITGPIAFSDDRFYDARVISLGHKYAEKAPEKALIGE